MNRLQGRLVHWEREHGVLLAEVQVDRGDGATATLTALMLHAGELPGWEPGALVELCFKETEIALAKQLHGDISLRNRFPATVTGLAHGKLLTAVQLQFGAWPLTAVITTGSAMRLQLQVGDAVEWLVKANEMQLQPIDADASP